MVCQVDKGLTDVGNKRVRDDMFTNQEASVGPGASFAKQITDAYLGKGSDRTSTGFSCLGQRHSYPAPRPTALKWPKLHVVQITAPSGKKQTKGYKSPNFLHVQVGSLS